MFHRLQGDIQAPVGALTAQCIVAAKHGAFQLHRLIYQFRPRTLGEPRAPRLVNPVVLGIAVQRVPGIGIVVQVEADDVVGEVVVAAVEVTVIGELVAQGVGIEPVLNPGLDPVSLVSSSVRNRLST